MNQILQQLAHMQFSSIFQPTTLKQHCSHLKNVTIYDPATSSSIQCQLFLGQDNLLYVKLTQKPSQIYQTTSKTKIQPVYSAVNTSKPLLEEIKLHENYQYLVIQSQNKQDLEQIYTRLKKVVPHKGFSEYFKPVKKLGKGAFASVYLIQHKLTKQFYAAKVFSREGQKLEFKGKEALENQIRMLRTLSHPNIIKYQGMYQTDNLIYLVTQHLSGGTLEECMRDKCNLTQEVISNVLKDILTALNYLQMNHIMHRDLKPQNILRRESDKKWVIIDFGLSAFSNQDHIYEKCGTLGYIAPQILKQNGNQQNKQYSLFCDIYSLGIIAYEMIFGTLPFKVQTQGIFEKKIVWSAFKSDQSSLLPQEVKKFLEGLMQTNPKERLPAKQALQSPIFNNKDVLQSWHKFGQKKRDERYERILKMANLN